MSTSVRELPRIALVAGCVAAAGLAAAAARLTPIPVHASVRQQAPAQRTFTVVLRKYAIEPAVIEVNQNDLVKVTLRSSDIAHSFTVDDYRIAKRVGSGQSVTFEFRADRAGRFPVYCNLRQDDGCREIRGELIVHPH